MSSITITVLDEIRSALADTDEEIRAAALEALGSYMGAGEPADADQAEALGPDYICAMDDGRIVAWGADIVIAPGVSGREIIIL